MQEAELREVIRAVFDEESARRTEAMDDVVIKAVAAILASFGVDEDDRKELRADFIHLRRWRKSVEQAQGMTLRAVIVVIVSGLAGAVWLGMKTLLVKS
jgi:uncharacterized protein (UPF0371 family)